MKLNKSLLIFAALGLATMQAWAWKPIFVGHRGCLHGVENTVEAYRNGVDQYGYQGLECDVRVTSDGQYVISHDETTNRLGGNLTVATATLAQLQAESYTQTRSGVTYTGKICTMAEYLDICVEKNVFPVIELKWSTGINSNDMSNFPGLAQLIISKGLADKVIILTSMKNSLEYVRANYPQFKCQWLCASGWESSLDWAKEKGIDVSIQTGCFDIYGIKKVATNGMSAAAWTIDTETSYKQYGNMGITMMTCNSLMPSAMPELADINWDNVIEPQDPIALKVDTVFMVSAAKGNLPADFPSGNSGTTAYTTAQEGWWHDGLFYVSNYGTSTIVTIDENGVVKPSELAGTNRHGLCFDEAGNMILNAATAASTPNKLLLYPNGSANAININIALNENGQNNFITASGDVMSHEGGYVYFLPNGKNKVNIVKIAGGEFVETTSTPTVSINGSTASLIIPINNDPANFIYQVRSNGFYMFENGADKGGFVSSGATTAAPGRNSSVGGAYFKLGGHNIMLHGSGSNYNGGFTVKDMSANATALFTQPVIGTNGYSANPSCGAFYTVDRKDEDHVFVYEYCMGNGIAAYQMYVGEPWNPETTAVTDVAPARTVKSVTYHNLSGMQSSTPFPGINIEVTTYTDGSKTTKKTMR